MKTVGIIGNGPIDLLPDLSAYVNEVDVWIGADRGALTLIEQQIEVDYALGDFDSINADEQQLIYTNTRVYRSYPNEKDQTDLELACLQAMELNPTKIYLFGATGGRMDHTLANIYLLATCKEKEITSLIVDQYNKIEWTEPGEHVVTYDQDYPNISFIPYTRYVKGLTLHNFYYPLTNQTVAFGSTLCLSNKLLGNRGTFSYEEGILLLIKSCD
ncbi:MAG TPA: thiamine diphosphokinase [Bacillota bacterium]